MAHPKVTPRASPEASPAAFSDLQKKALGSRARRILVSAGAGSGKTRILVGRFLDELVRGGIRPEEIIAIAFSNKSAHELKERLFRDLAGISPALAHDLVERGNVETIHGLCVRLLRENPVDAGLDPAFAVMERDLTALIKNEMLDEVLRENWDRPGIARLFRDFTEDTIRESILAVYGRWRTRPGEPVVPAHDVNAIDAIEAKLHTVLSSYHRTDPRDSLMPEAWAFIQEGWRAISDENWEDRIRVLEGLIRLGSLKRKETRTFTEELRAVSRDYLGAVMDLLSLPLLKGFLELLRLFDEAYAGFKRRRCLVDFDDLILSGLRLLERDPLKETIQSQCRWVMVDEYQDVDALQSELITRLSDKAHLFLVGDLRQSIYGFRHADPTRFLEESRKVVELGGDRVELCENFRSDQRLLELINGLFETEEITDGLPFGRLEPKRVSRTDGGAVSEVLIVRREAGALSARDFRRLEAHALARCLKGIVEGESRGVGAARRFRYADVALLLPFFTDSDLFEEALRSHRIPYHRVKGRGFYTRLEIVDLVNALKLLLRSDDELALVSVLKSPLVGLSDNAVYLLTRPASRGGGLWEFLRSPESIDALSPGDADKARHFLGWFDALLKEKGRLPLDETFMRIIHSARYDAALLGSEDGLRRYANVLKLIDKARSFERYAGGDHGRFVKFLKTMASADTDEAEAAMEPEKGDAVKLLTVHDAKGLEFPLVAVACLDAKGRRGKSHGPFLLKRDMSLAGALMRPRGGGLLQGKRYQEARDERDREEFKEYMRLFYVALTRARERVILSGVWRKSADDRTERENDRTMTWMDRLMRALPALKSARGSGTLPFHDTRLGYQIVEPSVPVEKDEGLVPRDGGHAGFISERLRFARRGTFEPSRRAVSALEACRAARKMRFQTIDLAVSSVLEHVPGARVVQSGGGARPGFSRPEGARVGEIFHRAMERIDFLKRPAREIERQMRDHRHELRREESESLRNALRAFMRHPGTLRIAEAIRRGNPYFREFPFWYRIRKNGEVLGFLKGQIDLLYRSTEGRWILVDYKTGVTDPSRHQDQIRFYAVALRALSEEPIEKAFLYYSATDRYHEVMLDHPVLDKAAEELVAAFEKAGQAILASEREASIETAIGKGQA